MSYPAAILRSIRLARGVSQDDLARAAGITKSYLSHIEHGRRHGPEDLLQRITEHLDAAADGCQRFRIAIDGTAGPTSSVEIQAGNLRDALAAAAELPESAWTGGWS